MGIRYEDLVSKKTSEAEMKAYLSKGDNVAVTVRIPANLKEAATDYAAMSGMSFSALLRNCLIKELTSDKDKR